MKVDLLCTQNKYFNYFMTQNLIKFHKFLYVLMKNVDSLCILGIKCSILFASFKPSLLIIK